MKFEELLYPEAWFSIGGKELKRAENLLNLHDMVGAGFNIQQSIEKYLKGYLLSQGWKLRRIHDLESLLNDVIIYEPSFEKFRLSLHMITHYYVEERYPLLISSELTEEEVKDSLAIAESIIEKIKGLIED